MIQGNYWKELILAENRFPESSPSKLGMQIDLSVMNQSKKSPSKNRYKEVSQFTT